MMVPPALRLALVLIEKDWLRPPSEQTHEEPPSDHLGYCRKCDATIIIPEAPKGLCKKCEGKA